MRVEICSRLPGAAVAKGVLDDMMKALDEGNFAEAGIACADMRAPSVT
jgi:hypothetical protein